MKTSEGAAITGDIIQVDTDAIVNAANNELCIEHPT